MSTALCFDSLLLHNKLLQKLYGLKQWAVISHNSVRGPVGPVGFAQDHSCGRIQVADRQGQLGLSLPYCLSSSRRWTSFHQWWQLGPKEATPCGRTLTWPWLGSSLWISPWPSRSPLPSPRSVWQETKPGRWFFGDHKCDTLQQHFPTFGTQWHIITELLWHTKNVILFANLTKK